MISRLRRLLTKGLFKLEKMGEEINMEISVEIGKEMVADKNNNYIFKIGILF